MLFLPQKPYIPIGSLRDAVTYPSVRPERHTPTQSTDEQPFTDDAISEALRAAGLAGLAERLDEERNWSMTLSGGEQQRLAVARALLHRPDWLFLDEATSALDEGGERHIYDLLRERLPGATLVSIAHRPSVAGYHDREVKLVPEGDRMVLAPA
jgi:putative ATP-binding cassette transporter